MNVAGNGGSCTTHPRGIILTSWETCAFGGRGNCFTHPQGDHPKNVTAAEVLHGDHAAPSGMAPPAAAQPIVTTCRNRA